MSFAEKQDLPERWKDDGCLVNFLMLKALRNSTLKQRDSRDEIVPVKSRKRSFKSQVRLKKRSENLIDLIRQEEDLFHEEIQELYQLFSIYEDLGSFGFSMNLRRMSTPRLCSPPMPPSSLYGGTPPPGLLASWPFTIPSGR
jgi:hypothetical protein